MARPIGCRFGAITMTSATAVVMSLVSTSIVLTIAGKSYTITLAAVGDDRDSDDEALSTTLGYSGSQVVVLPKPFTRYAWTATQGANSLSGSVMSAPRPSDDFALGFATCFSPWHGPVDHIMSWDFFEDYRAHGALPLAAILFSDDVCYADAFLNNNGCGYSDSSGKTEECNGGQTNRNLRNAYDYALVWGSWYGITGPLIDSLFGADDMLAAPHSATFQSLLDNTAIMVQWGDHDLQNNLGWPATFQWDPAVFPNALNLVARDDLLGNGNVVWEKLAKPLQGTALKTTGTDTVANHWYTDIGPIRFVGLDPITHSELDLSVVLSTAQIVDVLSCIQGGKQAFTILGLSGQELRGFSAEAGDYKRQNFCAAEYNRLFLTTGQTPPALMDHAMTNGTGGVLIPLRGDWHGGLNLQYSAPATATEAAEDFLEINLCNVNSCHLGVSQRGAATCEMLDESLLPAENVAIVGGCSRTSSQAGKAYRAVATILEVYGSRIPKEMVMKQWDIEKPAAALDSMGAGTETEYFRNDLGTYTDYQGNVWRCIYERKWVQWDASGNIGIEPSEKASIAIPSSLLGTDL